MLEGVPEEWRGLEGAEAALARTQDLIGGLDRSTSTVKDFNFLYGRWALRHERLNERMAGSEEWTKFNACFECRPLMAGAANIDQGWTRTEGDYFEGVSLRTFDAAEKLWTIFWMDTTNPVLREQVKGVFKDSQGEFYGVEAYKGRLYVMRFLWFEIGGSPYWEQAYEHPSGTFWETNWTMDFTRSESCGPPPG